MTNQNSLTIWQGQEIPTPTPQHAQSLTPDALAAHRAAIAFDVEVILDGYWKDRPSEAIKTGILADWSDALEDWQHEQVVYGLRKWRNENPNKKPNPGHILSILKAERGKAEVSRAAMAKHSEPNVAPHKPTDKERQRMADYAASMGYGPKPFPKVGEVQ